MQVIENTRSGVIHTRRCGNVQQMNKENMLVFEVNSTRELNSLSICEHCRVQEQLERIDELQRQQTLPLKKLDDGINKNGINKNYGNVYKILQYLPPVLEA